MEGNIKYWKNGKVQQRHGNWIIPVFISPTEEGNMIVIVMMMKILILIHKDYIGQYIKYTVINEGLVSLT